MAEQQVTDALLPYTRRVSSVGFGRRLAGEQSSRTAGPLSHRPHNHGYRVGPLRVGSRPPRTVRGPAHGGLSPASCGPPPFLLNSHSEGRSTQSAVGLSNSCSLNQEWVPSFNANPPRIGGCILQLDQTSPQASTGSCRERVHRKQQVRSSPVVPRHDPLHELIEHRHREGGVAVIGAPDHALGDQGAACRSQ